MKRIRGLGSHAAAFVADVLAHFAQAYADVVFGEALGPLHDSCAVLALTRAELFDLEGTARRRGGLTTTTPSSSSTFTIDP